MSPRVSVAGRRFDVIDSHSTQRHRGARRKARPCNQLAQSLEHRRSVSGGRARSGSAIERTQKRRFARQCALGRLKLVRCRPRRIGSLPCRVTITFFRKCERTRCQRDRRSDATLRTISLFQSRLARIRADILTWRWGRERVAGCRSLRLTPSSACRPCWASVGIRRGVRLRRFSMRSAWASMSTSPSGTPSCNGRARATSGSSSRLRSSFASCASRHPSSARGRSGDAFMASAQASGKGHH
jgi:hypothetical protein